MSFSRWRTTSSLRLFITLHEAASKPGRGVTSAKQLWTRYSPLSGKRVQRPARTAHRNKDQTLGPGHYCPVLDLWGRPYSQGAQAVAVGGDQRRAAVEAHARVTCHLGVLAEADVLGRVWIWASAIGAGWRPGTSLSVQTQHRMCLRASFVRYCEFRQSQGTNATCMPAETPLVTADKAGKHVSVMGQCSPAACLGSPRSARCCTPATRRTASTATGSRRRG